MEDRRALLASLLSLAATGCDPPDRTKRLKRERAKQRMASLSVCRRGLHADEPSRWFDVLALESLSWSALSPDGRTLLVRADRELHFVSVGQETSIGMPLDGPNFGLVGPDGSLAWSSDSRSVWLLTGRTSKAGWTLGRLACARRTRSGRLIRAPRLRGLPGRLDRVTWVDGDGLGLAQYDLRGGYYRPEQPNPHPGLAVIDARRGVVRTILPLQRAITRTWGAGSGEIHLWVHAAAKLPDGRVRAVLSCGFARAGPQPASGGLAVWTEGEDLRPAPREVGEGDLTFKFTPSGDQVLVSWPLSASGSINEDRRPSPPPTPQTGRYAALYDLAWRPAWSLSGTVSTMPGMNPTAISEDGRLGLLRLPETCGRNEVLGVVDLRDGAVRRRLKAPTSGRIENVGFHGDTPWATSRHGLFFFA